MAPAKFFINVETEHASNCAQIFIISHLLKTKVFQSSNYDYKMYTKAVNKVFSIFFKVEKIQLILSLNCF